MGGDCASIQFTIGSRMPDETDGASRNAARLALGQGQIGFTPAPLGHGVDDFATEQAERGILSGRVRCEVGALSRWQRVQ